MSRIKSNVLLISSSFEDISLMSASHNKEDGLKLAEDSHYPVGLASLHAYLEFCGNNVRMLALNHYTYESCFDEVVKTIREFSPNIVGLQILTPNRVSSFLLIEYIHEKYPDIRLVIGGIHASIMYRQLLEKHPFLLAVIGEGELTFAELVDNLTQGKGELIGIDGIAYNNGWKIVKTKTRELIGDLDILPYPKHEMFFSGNRTSGCILTTRGCPFKCSFCSLDSISRRTVRFRSVGNVVDEIEYMIYRFPQMDSIWIHDDTFFIDNKRVIEFCDEILSRRIKMKFICSGRMKPLSTKMINKLEDAGFVKVMLGLESGNDKILEKTHKAITKKDALNAFKMFSNSPIELHSFLIAGLPGENLETVMETASFVKELQKIKYTYYPDIAALLTIYPGTEVYEIAKAKDMIDDSFWLSDNPTPLFTVENSKEQLFQYKEIYMNHLSLDRFWTKDGLGAQLPMLPYILKYLVLNIRKPVGISRLAKFILPEKIYEVLVVPYRFLSRFIRH